MCDDMWLLHLLSRKMEKVRLGFTYVIIGERARHCLINGNQSYMLFIYILVRVKKFVPNKKGDIAMEVYYLCQPNTMLIIWTSNSLIIICNKLDTMFSILYR